MTDKEPVAIPVYEVVVDTARRPQHRPLMRAFVRDGDPITVRCNISGANAHPTASVQWVYEGNDLDASKLGLNHTTEDGRLISTLGFGAFRSTHQGHYECRIKRKDSQFSSSSIRLRLLHGMWNSPPNVSLPNMEACSTDILKCYKGACFKHTPTDISFCRCLPDWGGNKCQFYLPRVLTDHSPVIGCQKSNGEFSPTVFAAGGVFGALLFLALYFTIFLSRRSVFSKMKRSLSSSGRYRCSTELSTYSSLSNDCSMIDELSLDSSIGRASSYSGRSNYSVVPNSRCLRKSAVSSKDHIPDLQIYLKKSKSRRENAIRKNTSKIFDPLKRLERQISDSLSVSSEGLRTTINRFHGARSGPPRSSSWYNNIAFHAGRQATKESVFPKSQSVSSIGSAADLSSAPTTPLTPSASKLPNFVFPEEHACVYDGDFAVAELPTIAPHKALLSTSDKDVIKNKCSLLRQGRDRRVTFSSQNSGHLPTVSSFIGDSENV